MVIPGRGFCDLVAWLFISHETKIARWADPGNISAMVTIIFYICSMWNKIRDSWEHQPLTLIILVGAVLRLIAALFSKGYGMHDDHFLIIEAAQSWIDGYDYNNWLPENSPNGRPTGHSFFYVGLHYLLFRFLEMVSITDPQFKMFVVRLIHAALSMVTVVIGYRMTCKIAGEKTGKLAGLVLAVWWFMPILSVRNLVEVVCIPPLMYATWVLFKNEEDLKWKHFVLAGIFMGLAIAVRIQSYLFMGGIGLVLLFRKQLWGAILFGVISLLTLFFTQITDLFLWGYPFAEFSEYILYNMENYTEYIVQGWHTYLLLVAGILVPPISLFLLFGYLRYWKKYLLLFLPAFLFFVFHSYYPNKQERFILPVIPFFLVLGIGGWTAFVQQSKFWQQREKLYRGCWKAFWILNTLALLLFTASYTKRSRVESMSYLMDQGDVSGMLIERTNSYGCHLLPRFYLDKWNITEFCLSKNNIEEYDAVGIREVIKSQGINYILFVEKEEYEARLARFRTIVPGIEYVEVIEPSYIDKLLHWLNPRNQNESIYIYRVH